MGSRRPWWYIPANLVTGFWEILHGIPQARADMLRAQAEQRWLACLRGYLDLLDRLHVPVHCQREILAQIMLVPARKRSAGRAGLRSSVVVLLESTHKLIHPADLVKRAHATNLRPLKRKIS